MGKRLSVVFLVDALGWEVSRRFGFCRKMLPYRSGLGTVLGYSSAAIPSLLSGCSPNQHGAWSMYRLARENSPFRYLRYLPRLPRSLEWRSRRLVRRIADRRGDISAYYDLYDIPLSLLSRFDLAQYQDPYLPGGLARETIFDVLTREGVPYRLWYYKTAEAENMREVEDALGGGYDLLFLYTAELDALEHRVGIFDPAVEKKLAVYEKFLAAVLERGRRLGLEMSIYVISDHGMTEVTKEVDLWGYLDRRGFRIGRDYLAFFDSTMARFWSDGEVTAAAAEYLSSNAAGRLVGGDELERFGCFFEDGSYGRSVFLTKPGTMIVPSFMGRERLAAMHGYDPDDEYSKGCFLTNDGSDPLPASILDFKSYLVPKLTGAIA